MKKNIKSIKLNQKAIELRQFLQLLAVNASILKARASSIQPKFIASVLCFDALLQINTYI